MEGMYFAEVARFNEEGWGEGRSWGFYVSPDKYRVFTLEAAKEILEWGTKEFASRFNEEIDFNFISLKSENAKRIKEWRDRKK